jgi:hypothetical protein
MLRHAIDFSLQLLGSDWLVPIILQRLRISQVICDFPFELRQGHYCVERWLKVRTLCGPDTVVPVNLLNRSLISYALCKRKHSLRAFRWCFGMEESQQCSSDQ